MAKIGMLKEPSGRVRYLTDDEEKALMKALATDADRERVTVLLQTGLRKSEFLGLRWKDIDLKGWRAHHSPLEEWRAPPRPAHLRWPRHHREPSPGR